MSQLFLIIGRYTCESTTPTFFGCCMNNPCNPNGCPASDLRAAALGTGSGPDFSTNDGSYYSNANCSNGLWYSCATTDPSFQGCCGTNPCNAGGKCPASSLYRMRLPRAFHFLIRTNLRVSISFFECLGFPRHS
jgi:hypothetical protein